MFSKKFVKATATYCTYEKPVSAPYLRRVFTLDKLPEKAGLTLTATGFYRAFVNGTEITPSRFAPYITNPDSLLFYDTIDVRPFLTKGKNCVAFLLGNGLADCMGGYIWDFDLVPYRSAPAVAFALEMDSETLEADTGMTCHPSPIFFDDLRSGEFYDAQQELAGWNTPDFDDSGWDRVLPAETPRGETAPNTGDPVVITKELLPARVFPGRIVWNEMEHMRTQSIELSETAFYQPEEKESGLVFDFGETVSCVPQLKLRGHKGQKIILQASDFCTDSGDLDYSNIQRFYPFGFCQRDIYICRGEGEEVYVPSFTYHGARYFLVMGLEEGQLEKDTLTMLVMNSDLKERGHFLCSDDIANRLCHAARNSTLANFVCFPTDCPHREKNGWTGDAAMSAEHTIQNLAPEKSWKQWLKMIALTQKPSGQLPGIIPTGGWGYEWGNGPVWDQVIAELPYQAYRYRGDLSLFEAARDTIWRYMNYASGRRDRQGLIHIGLGDWCPTARSGASNHLCPEEVTDTAACFHICTLAAEMYRACGQTAQAAFAESLGQEFRAAFRKHLIDPATLLVRGRCQTSQATALYYGLFDPAETAEAYRRLLALVHEADNHFDCGMIGVRVLFRTLAQYGDAELAYRMITRTDYPSYGIWVEKFGLTALPESFHPTADGYTTSLNHHFMGDFNGFFIAHIAGLQINPCGDDPAFVRFAPCFVSDMQFAETHYDTVSGRVFVRWERLGDKQVVLHADMPEAVSGELVLPQGWQLVSAAGMKDDWAHARRYAALRPGDYIAEKVC